MLRRCLTAQATGLTPARGVATRFEEILGKDKFKEWDKRKKELLKTLTREKVQEMAKKFQEEKARGVVHPPPLAKFEVDPSIAAYNVPEDKLPLECQHPYFISRYREWRQPGFQSPLTKLAPVINEFKLPMKLPTAWIENFKVQEFEWMDDLCCVTPCMGWDMCAETDEYFVALMEATLKTKGLRPKKVGQGWCAYNLKICFDYKFQYGKEPTTAMWNLVLRAAALEGEWRLAYQIEDFLNEKKIPIDDEVLKRIDEIAYEAHLNGWTLATKYRNMDITSVLTAKTVGGVGAYIPPYLGQSWGFNLWREHQKLDAEQKNAAPKIAAAAK